MKQSDVYRLHQKYSTGEKNLEIGWKHSLIVKEISLQIADRLEKEYSIKTDRKLLEFGALTHDIGFYQYFDKNHKMINKDKYIEHGRVGYEILIKEKISKRKARFALTHVGVGYKKDIPISLEEEIVGYADNFHSKGRPQFNSFEESLDELNKINPDFGVIFVRFRDKFEIPDLSDLKGKYKKWHKEINEWIDGVK